MAKNAGREIVNWLWISGWAVPPAWLAVQAQAAWPRENHAAVTPMDAAQALSAEKFDVLGGYSLGALWLLRQAKAIPENVPVVLLAPILAFTEESGCGGRVARAQLQLQRRRLRAQPTAAIADFFQRAGLAELNELPSIAEWNAPLTAALNEELGWLEDWSVSTVPKNWHGFIGDNDPLLDALALKKIWSSLHIVSGATHAPGLLMAAAKKFLSNITP